MSVPASYNNGFTLPASGRLLLPFDVDAAIMSLPVYCGSPYQASVISYATRFLYEDYHFTVRACPSTLQQGGSNTILAMQSFEDNINVPAGSFLVAVAGKTNQTDAAFRTRWYDAGAQDYISDGFVHSNCCTGRFVPDAVPLDGSTLTGSKNLFILPSPLSITAPGQLNVQIVNLSANTAIIDMAFFFAVPNGNMGQTNAAVIGNAVRR